MTLKCIFFVLLLGGILGGFTSDLPVPPDAPERLFYIQRSNNAHTVIYDANWLPGSRTFHSKEPVKVYWIRYADRGQVEELTYLQRTMAYGVETKPIQDGYELWIAAFKKRSIRVLAGHSRPLAITRIAGKDCRLKRIFVQLVDNTCLIPKVAYVELFGSDMETGRPAYERFVP